ncbi:unnamed protein product, partial [marine sediment metagenome]
MAISETRIPVAYINSKVALSLIPSFVLKLGLANSFSTSALLKTSGNFLHNLGKPITLVMSSFKYLSLTKNLYKTFIAIKAREIELL